MKIDVASLFSGCGGLDLGFESAGFDITWANEYDSSIWDTFSLNFPNTRLDKRSILDIPSKDVPNTVGIIGGPPCQSWSEAGAGRGINDQRGQLFYEYIRILSDKNPLFFLAENVSGMLLPKHKNAFQEILKNFKNIGYEVSCALINAKIYGIPQDRKRVIFVGYNRKMGKKFEFPKKNNYIPTLKDAIWDLKGTAKPAKKFNKSNGESLQVMNHEYMTGGFSTIYMSRNRVRNWNEQSFTIQAGGRHAPLHPQAPKMKYLEQDKRMFVEGKEKLYRRLSVRECARIQTFPDTFVFKYHDISDGYKMVGNAVPVKFAKRIAGQIYKDLQEYSIMKELTANKQNNGQIVKRTTEHDHVKDLLQIH